MQAELLLFVIFSQGFQFEESILIILGDYLPIGGEFMDLGLKKIFFSLEVVHCGNFIIQCLFQDGSLILYDL